MRSRPAICFLFASVAVSAIGYAFSGRLTSQMPGWEVISWVLVIALPLSIPAAALTMPADISHIALKPWLGLLYVALFSQWIGFFAWNAGLAMGGIARVSQIQLLQPFVTFALASVFNDETITLQILLFAAAVVATVAISTRTRAKPAPNPRRRSQRRRNAIASRLSWRHPDRSAPDTRRSIPPWLFSDCMARSRTLAVFR